MIPDVDVIVLSRDESPLAAEVEQALAAQRGVRLHGHRIIGEPKPGDANRWQYIARARNRGAALGRAPWCMFVDDDVVLHPDCIRRLVAELQRRPSFAAMAADYLGEAPIGRPSRHVAMGATLFRRSLLQTIRFRWAPGRCECQCCCDDLRAAGREIAYSSAARAFHRRRRSRTAHSAPAPQPAAASSLRPRILTAFNRAHAELFRQRFIGSLRRSGNDELVTAVTYGLERQLAEKLGALHRVEVIRLPASRFPPARDRLRGFQHALAQWHPQTPVAYWDAGDVWFQSRLQPLWKLVRQHPRHLLVAREAISHPENKAVAGWTLSIRDGTTRRAAFALLSNRPFFNAGFAAGTAATMLRYLQYARRLRESTRLEGTRDRWDQMTFNLYCHANPSVYKEVERGWNFCLFGLNRRDLRRQSNGLISAADGTPVHVIHGNAGTFDRFLPTR